MLLPSFIFFNSSVKSIMSNVACNAEIFIDVVMQSYVVNIFLRCAGYANV
jgi:hypothetical protein